MSVIDVVPLESSDSSDSQILVAESLTSNGHNENGQQVTAQGEITILDPYRLFLIYFYFYY